MNPITTHGAFSWAELMTPEPEAAAAFYAEILGYSVDKMEMKNGPYHLLMDGETPRAGVSGRPDPDMPPNWAFYITVDDVDATAEKATQLGAKQEWPVTDVPDVGRMTGFTDPLGAYFAIITYSYPPMEGPEPDFADSFQTHGAFSWFELRTPDPDVSKKFYSELFGWEIKAAAIGEESYDEIKVDGSGMGGIIPPPAPNVPPHWGGYITVDDADAVAEAAKEAGGSVALTMDVPEVGRFHGIKDPQGAVVSVIKYYPMPEEQA